MYAVVPPRHQQRRTDSQYFAWTENLNVLLQNSNRKGTFESEDSFESAASIRAMPLTRWNHDVDLMRMGGSSPSHVQCTTSIVCTYVCIDKPLFLSTTTHQPLTAFSIPYHHVQEDRRLSSVLCSMGARLLARLITSLPIDKVDVVPALSEARLPVTHWCETSTDASYPFQSAAQTLPCEIICLIFSFLDWYSPRRLAPGVYGPFWAATHVCHQWREALRGEARLWTKLAVCMPIAGDCHTENRIWQLFSGALERSKKLPLHIELYSPRMSFGTTQVLMKIMGVAPRITSLRLELPMRFINILLFPGNPTCFSKVAYLRVNGRLDADWQSVDPVLWQRTFPTLVDVRLEGLGGRYLTSILGPCTWKGIDVHILATNVEDLRISAELLKMMKDSPNLQSIQFNSSWFPPLEYEDPVVPDASPSWHEAYDAVLSTFNASTISYSVRYLHLGSWEAGILPAILTLPNLSALNMNIESLSADDARGTRIFTGVEHLLTRSQFPLTSFSLTMTDVHENIFTLLLDCMPQLRNLTLNFQADTLGCLEFLFDDLKLRDAGDEREFTYLPSLWRLRLEVMPSFTPSGDASTTTDSAMERAQLAQIQNTNQAFVEMVLDRWDTVDDEVPVLSLIELDVANTAGGLLNLGRSSIELLEDRRSSLSTVRFEMLSRRRRR
ncbi:hypothetical protein BDZ89DRAFT_1177891 [Hymenopellis radicata]|nr:hypothetical protein BDZ89DRAFT_1177891 [Hymenopellis radicata]